MKKIIEIKHHLDDYECMWNGIEDIYMDITKEELPDQFFFAMSGFCGFVYLNTPKGDLKKMVSFGDGRTKQMYEMLSPYVGFDYQFKISSTPLKALDKAKKEIDQGYPVVIGALDMYYLPYFSKLYHQVHIPFHYVLMVGYNDEEELIYIHDCGREEVMTLSYSLLLQAMNAQYPGLCKPNTICQIRMNKPKTMQEITKNALAYKAKQFLNPPTSFIGFKGMLKLAKELNNWEEEIGVLETKRIITNLIDFFGSVPTTPNRLLGINEKDDVVFMASRDKMSKVLKSLANKYQNPFFDKASECFNKSAILFNDLCNEFIDYLLNQTNTLQTSAKLIESIAYIEKEAYEYIEQGIDKL